MIGALLQCERLSSSPNNLKNFDKTELTQSEINTTR